MNDQMRRWVVASAALLTAGIAVPAAAAQFSKHSLQGPPSGTASDTGGSSVSDLAAATTSLQRKDADLQNKEKALRQQISQLKASLTTASQRDKQLVASHNALQTQVVGLVSQAEKLQAEAQAAAQRVSSQSAVQVVSRASGNGEGDDGQHDGGGGDD